MSSGIQDSLNTVDSFKSLLNAHFYRLLFDGLLFGLLAMSKKIIV